jgi:hypothetical protein
MAMPKEAQEETVLQMEIESRVRELQRAVARGEPPVHWKAQRNEIDDLWSRLLAAQAARATGAPEKPVRSRSR